MSLECKLRLKMAGRVRCLVEEEQELEECFYALLMNDCKQAGSQLRIENMLIVAHLVAVTYEWHGYPGRIIKCP